MDLLASMREEVGTAQRLHMVLLNDQEEPIAYRCLFQQRRSAGPGARFAPDVTL